MILFNKVSKLFGGQTLFLEADFQMQKGERCALLGRNGSGKTTLLRLITGEETPESGEIFYPKNYRLGWLKQHLIFSKATLFEEATFALPEEEHYKAEKILFGLGFRKDDLEKPPSAFSGGFQLRLHLCQILASEPDCLLLDEPTNYLDIASIRWMKKFLSDWKGELLLISHDRDFVDAVCHSCIGIHREKIRKISGPTERFYSTLFLEEEVHERTRVNQEKKKAHMQQFIDRFGAKATKAAQAQSRMRAIEKMSVLDELTEIQSLDFVFPFAQFPGKQMLSAQDLSFSYDPSQTPPLVDHFSLEIEKGERIAIIGENGKGKSTLLKLIAGECIPQKGHIKRSDNLQIGYFGQTNIARLRPELTIEEEVSSADLKRTYSEIRALCGVMLFEGDLAKKKISVLSGGEKSRVLLAKLLATPCNLLLLDEPTNHLDMDSVEALISALSKFPGSIVLITHSERTLEIFKPNKLIICRDHHQEVFLGDYRQFVDQGGWETEKPLKEKKTVDQPKGKKKSSADTQLKKEIAKLEKQWMILEEEIEKLEKQLIELSASSPDQIVTLHQLAQELSAKKKEAEACTFELEMKLKECSE